MCKLSAIVSDLNVGTVSHSPKMNKFTWLYMHAGGKLYVWGERKLKILRIKKRIKFGGMT